MHSTTAAAASNASTAAASAAANTSATAASALGYATMSAADPEDFDATGDRYAVLWALENTTKKHLHSPWTIVHNKRSPSAFPDDDRLLVLQYANLYASGKQPGKEFVEHLPELAGSETIGHWSHGVTGPIQRHQSVGKEHLSDRFLHAYGALMKYRGEPVSEHLAPGYIPDLPDEDWYIAGALAVPEASRFSFEEDPRLETLLFPILRPPGDSGFGMALRIRRVYRGHGGESAQPRRVYTHERRAHAKTHACVWEHTVQRLTEKVTALATKAGAADFNVDSAVARLLNVYMDENVSETVYPVGDCIGETCDLPLSSHQIRKASGHCGVTFQRMIELVGYVLLTQECVPPMNLQCIGALPVGNTVRVHVGDETTLTPRGNVTLKDGTTKKATALEVGDELKEGTITRVDLVPRLTLVYTWRIANLQHDNDVLAARKAAMCRYYYLDVPGQKRAAGEPQQAPEKRLKSNRRCDLLASFRGRYGGQSSRGDAGVRKRKRLPHTDAREDHGRGKDTVGHDWRDVREKEPRRSRLQKWRAGRTFRQHPGRGHDLDGHR